ncbi:aldose epimerase family protein [Sediminitomix flava]|uniref:Aldose 1-epimerase n=1 Tax=Sediminitomix flava TaxID=379075 RepID=A0A315ZT06_SEDFL|nr:aldose epimerase family protein [Sediminitomix flava]PWJ37960.1 aldose 1-epimerase [Sediminitomix flava]
MLNTETIEKRIFGEFEGVQIDQYILRNSNGMQVKVITYGACVSSILLPKNSDEYADVVCGFEGMEGYLSDAYKTNAPYFGCTVGRFSSRIKDGKFTLEGKDYQLDTNDGPNHLHGGINAFDKRIWNAKVEGNVLVMQINSADGDGGFPGNVDLNVSFELTEENALKVSYYATTDKATPLSFTNHSYFNLSGFDTDIKQTKAQILANKFLKPDETNVPVGETVEVSGRIDDLREGKVLGDTFKELETGFEHYYVFDQQEGLNKVAVFEDSQSGRSLTILTDEPGMLFYTGYFTSNELKRETGQQYGQYRGFCCEAHRYPNGPNISGAPIAITTPDQPYESETVYQFTF